MNSAVELWPPLALIRRGLTQERPTAAERAAARTDARDPQDAGATPEAPDTDTLLLPLAELARQREALAQRNFGTHCASGRLLSLAHGGRRLGVLLDQPLAATAGGAAPGWQGWVAASEADWAGPFDVLLEPGDEPFEPLLGVVQTWNPVRLPPSALAGAQVQGELSATRMAALRAVAAQAAQATPPALDIAPRPGRIALREVEGFTVLTGAPLAAQGDPRAEYQALYREAAGQWQAAASAAAAAAPAERRAGPHAGMQARMHAEERPGFLARLRDWLSPTGPWRPVAVALALVVVLQNVLLQPGGGEPDDVRFRNAPPASTAPAAPAADLVVHFQADAPAAQVAELLRRAGAQVVAGPDAAGGWSLRLLQPREGQAVLQSSPLVSGTQAVP